MLVPISGRGRMDPHSRAGRSTERKMSSVFDVLTRHNDVYRVSECDAV